MSHHPSPDEPPSAPPLPNRFFLQHHRSLSTSIFSAMSSRGCCRSRSGNGNGLCGLHLHDLFFSSRRSSYNSPPKDDDDDDDDDDDRDEAMEEAPSDQAPVSSWPDLWPRFGSSRRMNLMKDEDRFLVDHDLNAGGEDLNYVRPPRWKLFFRKLRSETKKMNCGSRPSGPGFQYDAVSYAMNFDDGSVWKQQQQQMQQQQAFLNSATSGGDKGFS